MAKTAKTTEKVPSVYHATHLTEKQKSDGVSYTYDWAKVTAPDHLSIRNKALLDAQEVRNSALDAEIEKNEQDASPEAPKA